MRHTQATREGRHLVAEDFAAVAALIPTQYPQPFGALVCQVPLLDMRRCRLLLAGGSWDGRVR